MSQSTSSGSSRSYPIVRLSPMKRKFSDSNCSTPSDAISAEASSSSSNPPPANINLSPLRVTRLNSPRKSVVVSYNNFPFDVARSSTGTTDRVGESDEVSPRKRRKIDFSDGHEHAQPSSAMPTTSREVFDILLIKVI